MCSPASLTMCGRLTCRLRGSVWQRSRLRLLNAMGAIVDLVLGVVTSIGGFVEVGSISTAAQAGSEFGYQLIWAIAIATAMLAMLTEMSGRLRPALAVLRYRYDALTIPFEGLSSNF